MGSSEHQALIWNTWTSKPRDRQSLAKTNPALTVNIKPNKDIIRKKIYRPICLKNINVKFLNISKQNPAITQ